MIKTVFAVVGLLWLAKRVAHAKKVETTVSEQIPTDPYSSVTWQWDALNGTNLTASGQIPNPHPAFFTLGIGVGDPQVSSPCISK